MEGTTNEVLFIATIIIVLVVVIFVTSYIRQQRKLQQFYQERQGVDINLLELERARVSADLHDQLGATVSGVKFKLMALKEGERVNGKTLDESLDHLDSLSVQIREIANNLVPTALMNGSLTGAIEDFIASLDQNGRLEINFKYSRCEIPEEYKIHLYRIVLEIIQNCIRHSGADYLSIELAEDQGILLLDAYDTGIGIKYETRRKIKPGSGIQNLKSRIDLMGGSLHLASTPGKGTFYTILIPVAKTNKYERQYY